MRRPLFLSILAVLFLSSCGMLDRMGIEKRRYMPGFFVERDEHVKVKGNVKGDREEKLNEKERLNANLNSGSVNSNSVWNTMGRVTPGANNSCRKDQQGSLHETKGLSPPLVILEKYKKIVPHIFLKAEHDTESLAGVLLALVGLLIGLGLIVLFPGISPQLAFAIGGVVALILLVVLALFVGKKKEMKTE